VLLFVVKLLTMDPPVSPRRSESLLPCKCFRAETRVSVVSGRGVSRSTAQYDFRTELVDENDVISHNDT